MPDEILITSLAEHIIRCKNCKGSFIHNVLTSMLRFRLATNLSRAFFVRRLRIGAFFMGWLYTFCVGGKYPSPAKCKHLKLYTITVYITSTLFGQALSARKVRQSAILFYESKKHIAKPSMQKCLTLLF